MIDAVALHHWGYTDKQIEYLVGVHRTACGSKTTGPPTAPELALVTLCAAAERLRKAGYEVVLHARENDPH